MAKKKSSVDSGGFDWGTGSQTPDSGKDVAKKKAGSTKSKAKNRKIKKWTPADVF